MPGLTGSDQQLAASYRLLRKFIAEELAEAKRAPRVDDVSSYEYGVWCTLRLITAYTQGQDEGRARAALPPAAEGGES